MKAKVKATGEVVEVRPERDGFFVDEENNNAYKFEELDFTYKEENPFSDMLSSMLNPAKEMQKDFKEQFYVTKFIEVFFDFFKLIQKSNDNKDLTFDESLIYTKRLMEEIRK